MDKVILHCDMNNFFASVETCINPSLANFPIAVSGNSLKRTGIILAKNYLAKVYGIKTGDVIWEAKQKCPELICVSPHYDAYAAFSKMANNIYSRYTDKIESFGIDESWLDVTASIKLFGSGVDIARNIQKDILNELGLTISIGVSFSKTLSKLGSDMQKPSGLVIIDRDNIDAMLSKVKLNDIIFIGRQTEKALRQMNINNLMQLKRYSVSLLKSKFGVIGVHLHNMLCGIDDDDIVPDRYVNSKNVGNGKTAPHDLTTKEEVIHYITAMSESVASRLRDDDVTADVVHLTLKFADFTYASGQQKKPYGFANCEDIVKESIALMNKFLPNSAIPPIRAVRVNCSGLKKNNTNHQLSLLSEKIEKKDTLGKTIDNLRKKYGTKTIFFPIDV